MRCGCPQCGEYMVQAEGEQLGCVCPACGNQCKDCMGTHSVVPKEKLKALANDPRFQQYMEPEKATDR